MQSANGTNEALAGLRSNHGNEVISQRDLKVESNLSMVVYSISYTVL